MILLYTVKLFRLLILTVLITAQETTGIQHGGDFWNKTCCLVRWDVPVQVINNHSYGAGLKIRTVPLKNHWDETTINPPRVRLMTRGGRFIIFVYQIQDWMRRNFCCQACLWQSAVLRRNAGSELSLSASGNVSDPLHLGRHNNEEYCRRSCVPSVL